MIKKLVSKSDSIFSLIAYLNCLLGEAQERKLGNKKKVQTF